MTASPLATATPSLDALWMPFTANKAYKARPRLLVSAKDMHYRTDDGRTILDGTAGLWCVNAGHCRQPIIDAMMQAASTLDYAPSFQMGHPAMFALADALRRVLPAGLDRVFLSGSGSEAVDSALKIALAYHQARGEPERCHFVGRQKGYHGVGFGGISVGGLENNRKAFAKQLLPHTHHLPHTHDLAHNAFSVGQPAWGAHLADALEEIIAAEGAAHIAAVIVEPVSGSAGVLIPPVGYLERLRALCTQHGILLIFDEVITGFGRVGAPFAAQHFGVTPDIITTAKGLTNAAVPMGATCVRGDIYDTVVNASPRGIELFHGYTYSGHPLAAAAGLAALTLYEQEGLLTRAATLAPVWSAALHSLRDAPHVIDIRTIGLIGGIELAVRDDTIGARGFDVFTNAFHEQDALIRVTGDTIALSPPLIISEAQIDELVGKVRRAIEAVG
ncbi:MAG: aminotransferase class III-fold pyridoxal phosphate-dependent enzyme [Gemmatimonadetes bacterium]|nr:aminotransferase class III-fold pyridoxal phosphate-dependent enzyme [Gemmatimonadota bacterium]